MTDFLQSTAKHQIMGGQGEEVITLMQSILSNKPVSCEDIDSLAAAKKETKRIRKLMENFKQSQKQKDSKVLAKKGAGARKAIHEEEHIDDYVKKVVPKKDNIRKMIYDAIKTNVLFESNTEDELKEIIDIFEPCSFKSGDFVIEQGKMGDEFYVVERGELSITVRMAETGTGSQQCVMDKSVNDVKMGSYQDGAAFGELALIYGSPRAATIMATDSCKLWRIKRGWYRGVVGQHRQQLHKEKVEFLPKVKAGKCSFKDILDKDQINTMAQLLKQEYFKAGDTIIREGEAGNTFYLIHTGEVEIYRKECGDKPIARWGEHKFFGEKALLSDDVRQATVVAASPVVVFVMTREDFTRVLGNLQDIMDGKVHTVDYRKSGRQTHLALQKVQHELKDLKMLNVLGQGAFGKVKLVKANNTGELYALKAQAKDYFKDKSQQQYIVREFRIMEQLSHPNILMLHSAMQDKRYIYFLMDLLPGGELMDLLYDKGKFPEKFTRFYAASVILAYMEFHDHHIAYRDLKPENLVLDARGDCIVVDLGLAKQLEDGPTYTFCGTPDYIAPEMIRGVGYDYAVDYWALGILLYELTAGAPPFESYDPTSTAKKILTGRVKYPPKFSEQLKSLIKALLTRDPTRRLGCMSEGLEAVCHHRFFHGFDWQGLLDREIDPPYKPKLPENLETIGRKDDEKDKAKETKWWPKEIPG